MIITLKCKVKSRYNKFLAPLAWEVNQVWNYVNALSFYMIRNRSKFLSAYDVWPYLQGVTKDGHFSIATRTLQCVAEEYVTRRKQFKKRKLRFRKSTGSKRSLGWVPFKKGQVRHKDGYLLFGKAKIKVFDSYGLEQYEFRAGSFNEDAQGNWWFNVAVEVPELKQAAPDTCVGVDLGLKTLATLSTGEVIAAPKFYRTEEKKLADAQKKKLSAKVKKIHLKIRNRRKDFLHKLSCDLTKRFHKIVVGDVSSSKLVKTDMAKSVLDSGWSTLKTMLEYKAIRRRGSFQLVNESWTSRTCSVCKNRTGPQGLEGLVIREWICTECRSVHDRDINAARNILALGN